MKTWIKENIALCIGVLMPVALAGAFVLAKVIPEMMVPAPAQDLLVSTNDYYSDNDVRFYVKDGKLWARFHPAHYEPNRRPKRLLRFIAKDMRVEEVRVTLKLPPCMTEGSANQCSKNAPMQEQEVAETASLVINQGYTSKDGYTFRARDYRSGVGLMGELLVGGSRYDERAAIQKDSRIIPLPYRDNRYYSDLSFIGWIE